MLELQYMLRGRKTIVVMSMTSAMAINSTEKTGSPSWTQRKRKPAMMVVMRAKTMVATTWRLFTVLAPAIASPPEMMKKIPKVSIAGTE